jgi:hypothetical protein
VSQGDGKGRVGAGAGAEAGADEEAASRWWRVSAAAGNERGYAERAEEPRTPGPAAPGGAEASAAGAGTEAAEADEDEAGRGKGAKVGGAEYRVVSNSGRMPARAEAAAARVAATAEKGSGGGGAGDAEARGAWQLLPVLRVGRPMPYAVTLDFAPGAATRLVLRGAAGGRGTPKFKPQASLGEKGRVSRDRGPRLSEPVDITRLAARFTPQTGGARRREKEWEMKEGPQVSRADRRATR